MSCSAFCVRTHYYYQNYRLAQAAAGGGDGADGFRHQRKHFVRILAPPSALFSRLCLENGFQSLQTHDNPLTTQRQEKARLKNKLVRRYYFLPTKATNLPQSPHKTTFSFEFGHWCALKANTITTNLLIQAEMASLHVEWRICLLWWTITSVRNLGRLTNTRSWSYSNRTAAQRAILGRVYTSAGGFFGLPVGTHQYRSSHSLIDTGDF